MGQYWQYYKVFYIKGVVMKQGQKSLLGKKIFFLALVMLIIATACASIEVRTEKSRGQIFLYGEIHGIPRILERQLEIWRDYYHNQNMRHMFIEFGFFVAEYLNVWMQSDNDDMLYELYEDWADIGEFMRYYIEFFRTIKREFPETVFHGIDVGFSHSTIGERFLQYLRDNDMQGTERYLLTVEAIEQREHFLRYNDFEFRVTRMTENFIREFDRLGDRNVMGIFGAFHTSLGLYSYSRSDLPAIPTMAQRLRERYGDSVHTTDLSRYARLIDPIRVDIISISGVDYEASYFGTDFTAFGDFVSRSFWRLENAYDDFSVKPTNGDWLPFDNYPMWIEINQVFVVDIARTDGAVLRLFFRSDGEYWYGMPITTGVSVD